MESSARAALSAGRPVLVSGPRRSGRSTLVQHATEGMNVAVHEIDDVLTDDQLAEFAAAAQPTVFVALGESLSVTPF
jgi:MoxR-like ATPase